MKPPKLRQSALVVPLMLLAYLFSGIAFSQTYMYVVPQTLEVHSGPSYGADVISELAAGDKVTVNEMQNDWAAITFWGRKGYVPFRELRTAGGTVAPQAQTNTVSNTDTYAPRAQIQPAPAKNTTYVLICDSENAYAYHSHTCSGLNRCTHGVLKVTVTDAQNMGRVPCKNCY